MLTTSGSGPNFSGEAKIHYGVSDFVIVETGAYVTCASTGKKVFIDQLRYWSEAHQEAYIDASASLTAWKKHQAEAQG